MSCWVANRRLSPVGRILFGRRLVAPEEVAF